MKRIKAHCCMSLQGCEADITLDFADDATEEDIEEAVRDWALEHFEWSWAPEEEK